MMMKRITLIAGVVLAMLAPLVLPVLSLAEDLPKERMVPEITFINASPSYDPRKFEAANLITKNWQDLGIRVNMVTLDFTPLYERIQNTTDWDAFVCGWSSRPERIDPDTFLNILFKTGESTNMMRYSNDEVDRIIEEQRRLADPPKRRELVYKAQAIIAEDVPHIVLFHVDMSQFINKKRFKSFYPTVGGMVNVWSMNRLEPLEGDGILRIAHYADIDTLNPMAAKHWEKESPLPMIYDSLVLLDDQGQPVPWVAEKTEQVDPTTYEVTIRKGITFHDGKPLTAEDVKFSYDFQKQWQVEYVTRYLKLIKEIEIIDTHKLRIKLEKTYSPLETVVFSLVRILPKHLWQNITTEKGLERPQDWPNTNPIGSGPYKFEYWRRGEEFKLVRNEGHFEPPKINGYIQHNYAHHDGVLLALEKQEADLNYYSLLTDLAIQAKQMSHLEDVSVSQIRLDHLGFNCQKEPFKRLEMRKALAHTVPWETIGSTILRGMGIPGKGFIAPSNKFWFNPNQKQYEFDMGKAKAILEQAGYEWDSDGRLYYPRAK